MNPAVRLLLLGGQWTPARLFAAGGQGGWWAPSDFSTMFQDSAGTTPVTGVGQPVGMIRDKSGRGSHLVQPTAASRPVLQQNSSGRFYLDFDGVDDNLASSSAIDLSGADKLTICCGIFKGSDAATGCFIEFSPNWGLADGTFAIFAPINAATPDFRWVAGGTAKAQVNPTGFAAPYAAVLTAEADISGAALSMRLNGSSVATSAATQGTGNFSSQTLYVGRRAGSGLPFMGRMYETLILGAPVNLTQKAQLERYIGSKIGINL